MVNHYNIDHWSITVGVPRQKKEKKNTMEKMSLYSWGACRHVDTQGRSWRIVFWFGWSVSRRFKFNECTHCYKCVLHFINRSKTFKSKAFIPRHDVRLTFVVLLVLSLSNKSLAATVSFQTRSWEWKAGHIQRNPLDVLCKLNSSCSAIN